MTKMRPPAHPVPIRIMHWIGASSHLRDAERLGDLQRVTQSAIHVSALDDSGLLWVIAEYSCAIDVASEFLIQVYGSAPISSQHF